MDNKDMSAFAADGQFGQAGLTKREYFAGLAMQGIESNQVKTYGQIADILGLTQDEIRNDSRCGLKARAKLSVSMADALLAALEDKEDE